MPNKTKDGMISKNSRNIMIFMCLRTKSNMRTISNKKNKKGERFVRFYPGGWWVLTGSNRRLTPCKGEPCTYDLPMKNDFSLENLRPYSCNCLLLCASRN